VARLGLADVAAFGLTWEAAVGMLSRLGYRAASKSLRSARNRLTKNGGLRPGRQIVDQGTFCLPPAAAWRLSPSVITQFEIRHSQFEIISLCLLPPALGARKPAAARLGALPVMKS